MKKIILSIALIALIAGCSDNNPVTTDKLESGLIIQVTYLNNGEQNENYTCNTVEYSGNSEGTYELRIDDLLIIPADSLIYFKIKNGN